MDGIRIFSFRNGETFYYRIGSKLHLNGMGELQFASQAIFICLHLEPEKDFSVELMILTSPDLYEYWIWRGSRDFFIPKYVPPG